MKKYIRNHNDIYRDLAIAVDSPHQAEFTELWQAKKYAEALNIFPEKWEWLGKDIENQLICDFPKVVGSGEAVSERAFAILHKQYPLETKLHHPFDIEGCKFIWFSPPVVEKDNFYETRLNLFIAKPIYRKVYSEDFVNFWKSQDFTGHEFEEITQP